MTTLGDLARAIAADLAYAWCASPRPLGDYLRDKLGPVFAERDAAVAVCQRLARLHRGPTPASRGKWIDNVLAIAEAARAAVALTRRGPGPYDEPDDPYDEPPGGEGGGA